MKQQLMTLLLGAASVFCSCETQLEQHVKSELQIGRASCRERV